MDIYIYIYISIYIYIYMVTPPHKTYGYQLSLLSGSVLSQLDKLLNAIFSERYTLELEYSSYVSLRVMRGWDVGINFLQLSDFNIGLRVYIWL